MDARPVGSGRDGEGAGGVGRELDERDLSPERLCGRGRPRLLGAFPLLHGPRVRVPLRTPERGTGQGGGRVRPGWGFCW